MSLLPLVLLACACHQPATQAGSAPSDGASQDGAAEDGAAEDGAAEDGAAQDGAAQDGAAEDTGPPPEDLDEDGYGADVDCDDADASVHPDATELCDDGIDQDCDGTGTGCRPQGKLSVEAGWVLLGEAGTELGGAMAAGELLAGGSHELVLGAPEGDLVQVHAFEGPEAGLSLALEILSEDPGDELGSAVAVGDVDGDGNPDLAIGARRSSRGAEQAGAVYVLRGPLAEGAALAETAILLTGGTAGDLAGGVLATGQLDEAAGVDLLVGAGQADLYAGSGGAAYVLTALDGDGEWSLDEAPARLGWSKGGAVAGSALAAADLDGDGLDDAIVGAFGDEGFAGAAAVALAPFAGDRDLATEADAVVHGAGDYDVCGVAVAAADTDGDGTAELMVACSGDDSGGSEAGLILAFAAPAGQLEAADATGVLLGQAAYDRTGWSLSAADDIDGDGRSELVAGAPGAQGSTGVGWLVYGPVTGVRRLSTDLDARWLGGAAGGLLGDRVLAPGDVTGDGVGDVLLAAPDIATSWLLAGSGL